MSGDKFGLVKVEKLDDLKFEEGEDEIEILMFHKRSGSKSFAVHGFLNNGAVGHLKEGGSYLNIEDCALAYTQTGEVETRFGRVKKAPNADFSTPESAYAFLREYNEARMPRAYRFPSNGAWEAYIIEEKKPEQEHVQPAEPAAAQESP
jgi:hypothetical protein